MASKFFAAGNVSSDDSQEEQLDNRINQDQRRTANVARGMQRSDSDDDKRKVVSEKDKKWNVIKKLCQVIKDKLKINDFSEVFSAYQEVVKEIEKSKNIISKQGYPSFYMKTIIKLIDDVKNFTGKSQLNKINGKQFSKLSQKLKKHEVEFEKQIQQFKNKKVESGDDEQTKIKKRSMGGDQDGDDNDEESEEEEKVEEVSESQSQDDKSPLQSTDPMIRRKYWMKKKVEKQEKKDLAEQEKQKQLQIEKLKKKKLEADTKGKKFKLVQSKERAVKFTSQQAKQTLKNALKQIGKKIDEEQKQWVLADINNIKQTLTSDSQIIASLIVQNLFITQSIRTLNKQKRSDWELIFNNISRMYRIINKSKDQSLLSSIESFEKDQDFYKPDNVLTSIVSNLSNLNEELKKSLVFIDAHEIEYYERLQDLFKLNELNYKLLNMYEERCAQATFCLGSLALQLIQNTYFFSEDSFKKLEQKYQSLKQEIPTFFEIKRSEIFERIARLALRFTTEKETKTKIVLYLIFNHAIFGRPQGKQMFLVSNTVDNIDNYSYYTQAIYNRALAQLGINAFIEGNLYDVQHSLSDLCGNMRTKQLLAQGFQKQEQQVQQRKRILPYYLHLNIDMIESIELIASMLNETPYIFKDGGRITSKTFKRIYELYQKSHFIAQPLSSKDIIYSASKDLQKSNWKECFQRLKQLEFWKLLRNSKEAQQNILKRTKEQALKCYLLANQGSFSVIKIDSLKTKFQISQTQDVLTIVNRLIFHSDLNASILLDGSIKFYHVEVNRSDKIIQQLSQKAQQLVTTNESNLKLRLGAISTDDDQQENIVDVKNNRRGMGSQRNKLLGVKKVVVLQRKK